MIKIIKNKKNKKSRKSGKLKISSRIIIIAVLSALLITCLFTMAACSKPTAASAAGKYVLTDVTGDPDGTTFADLAVLYEKMDLNIQDHAWFELTDDGWFTLVLFGEREMSGSFSLDGDILTLDVGDAALDGGGIDTAYLSGKTLKWIYENGATLVFEKSK